MTTFTPEQLSTTVAQLLRQNHFFVEGPVKIHGAEIDLIASPLNDPFAAKIYIEVTVEYVGNEKYGKDLTKLAMAREVDPNGRFMIVSSTGFTLNVRERAEATRIMTLTYDELFAKFERFDPYVNRFTGETPEADDLRALAKVYQPPRFRDSHGTHDALSWLDGWLERNAHGESWLIVVGEYGTGKTALTRMLQDRWISEYKSNPERPIPLRIELGNFTRQFDAQGLLHHFLDNNSLSHIPVDFLWSLIRSGRVILLLDGYDEMAQYLNQRERRECLRTLAELTSEGARGLLTSRPNYFSETEEFALFDHLYRNLELRSGYLSREAEDLKSREAEIDNFIERNLLERYERSLQDLSPEQTELLVRNILDAQPHVADTVIAILARVFRSNEEGSEVALSGKPVIISYLVEVAANLIDVPVSRLSEWDVYTLVLDKLALRDLSQAGLVSVEDRRKFLQNLAVWLTEQGSKFCSEDDFRRLIERQFSTALRRVQRGQRDSELESHFEDLRRSGSLTRDAIAAKGWKFSHNSLREFLVCERLLEDLAHRRPLQVSVPVSDAMRTFAVSRGADDIEQFAELLTIAWAKRGDGHHPGSYLSLLFEGVSRYLRPADDCEWHPLKAISGSPPEMSGVQMAFVTLSSEAEPASIARSIFVESELSSVGFDFADLAGSNFSGSLLDGVSFRSAVLDNAVFENAVLSDVSFSATSVVGADFSKVDDSISILVGDAGSGSSRTRFTGDQALGYLNFHGATTKEIRSTLVWAHYSMFGIITKIVSKFMESPQRQRRGLVQRGVASQNPSFARRFIELLEAEGWIRTPNGRPEIVELTSTGRTVLGSVASGTSLHPRIEEFLNEEQPRRR